MCEVTSISFSSFFILYLILFLFVYCLIFLSRKKLLELIVLFGKYSQGLEIK